ncbi:MAG TPA: TonB-dependent receptor [Steroidobacteraceae bacterium]|nr:TonB-dependent receptor [Steroidobacteraceae bacterium]
MAEQRRRGISAKTAVGWLASAAAPIAMAQSTTGPEASPALEEIVVSAQHREESLQLVPISMSAISGDTLENLGIKTFDQYAYTLPNLSVGAGAGSGGAGSGFGVSTTKTYTIRGVFGDNTTGVYLNDSPVPPSMDPRLLDLDRIEVLRGPQGTLYGAGSMGGTIRFVSQGAAIDRLYGKLEVEGFDVNAAGGGYSANGSVNVPLIEGNLSLHASFLSTFQPGLYTRVWGGAQDPRSPTLPFPPGPVAMGSADHVGAEHSSGVMVSLRATPMAVPGLTITPMFIYQRTRDNGYPVADYTPQDFVQTRPFDVPEAVGDTWDFESLTIKQETKFGNFVLIANRFYRDGYDLEDTSDANSIVFWGLPYYVPAPIIDHLYFHDYTGEARYESALPGPVQLVAGIYWSQEKRFYYQYFNAPGFNVATGGIYGTDLTFLQGSPNADHQRAAYADVTWNPLDPLRLSAGLRVARLSHEGTYIASGPLNGGDSHNFAAHAENDRAPRFTAQYRYSADQLLYAAAAKGFRIGGTNAYVPPQCDAALQELNIANGHEFASDSLWSYELGLKNSWADGRVKTRVAGYEIDWKNTQRVVVLPCVWSIVANVGASKSTGFEFELDAAPVQHLTTNFALGYEHARVTQGSQESHTVDGQPLQNVPRWTGSLTMQYSVPLDSQRTGFMSAQYSYTGSRTSYNNTQAGLELASYGLADFRLGVDQGPWQLALSVRNAFNKLGVISDLLPDGVQLPSRPRLFVTQPRTIGLQLRREFK